MNGHFDGNVVPFPSGGKIVKPTRDELINQGHKLTFTLGVARCLGSAI